MGHSEAVSEVETDNVVKAGLLNGDDKGFCGMEDVGHQSTGLSRHVEVRHGESSNKLEPEETSITRKEPIHTRIVLYIVHIITNIDHTPSTREGSSHSISFTHCAA